MDTSPLDHKSVNDQLKQIITPGGRSYYQVQLEKARMTAVVLALASLVTLIFLVFAFVQKAAADTAREEAVKNEIMAQKSKAHAIEVEAELAKCREKTD
jgi:hypothetical protein